MEADIKLCEELLAMDSFPGDKPGSKTSSAAAAAGAAASADGRLTEERRGEIMTRLNKHRSSASSASARGIFPTYTRGADIVAARRGSTRDATRGAT